jgi:hypothetical protein
VRAGVLGDLLVQNDTPIAQQRDAVMCLHTKCRSRQDTRARPSMTRLKCGPLAAGAYGGASPHAVLVGALVQLAFQVVIEREPGGGQTGVELLGAAGPDDGRRDRLIRQYPGD